MSSMDSELVDPEVIAGSSAAAAQPADAHGNLSKKRSSYFTPLELRLLLQLYEEHAHIFRKKSNKAVDAKARQAAWKHIAARVNACNSSGEKRTWMQLKTKYKNMIKKVNRKRFEAYKIDGELLIPPLTEDEGLAICQNSPTMGSEGLSGHNSPEPGPNQNTVTEDVFYIVEPPATATAEEDAQSSCSTKKEAEVPPERTADRHQNEVPSSSTAKLNKLPVNELYRHHLLKTIEKTDKEMLYLDRQIRKADLEILLLERQLKE
ncbi:PREDICTED: uncharacterized protein LOC107088525 [Cyprinodon variegatus]|uniref:uncharacterized protein LOC107088525 n=1 Tax=Cyprinodon variegatus TaxID=28743 RepID=UPI0007429F46|nr:PREDICTED: uncharacterized protein LOC107088525 [Cyprinodon variegatus]